VKKIAALALILISPALPAQQAGQAQQGQDAKLPLGVPGPDAPKGKAPEQGYVPEGWHLHAGGLLKYSVQIRFGEEPETMPEGMKFGRVSAVTTDSQNQVYVFKRDPNTDQLIVFDSAGTYVRSWGKGTFGRPHGLRVDREDHVWAVDDAGQQIFKFTREGKLLQTLGVKGVAGNDAKTFNRPTDLAWDSKGSIYVSDGYANSRVVKFDKSGTYLTSWGTPGSAPGRFRVPHSIGVDSKDRVYVSDRENNRIQVFDEHGALLKIWDHLGCTQSLFITPKDELWVLTHRNNTENITYDTLAGQIMRIDIETGRILGSMESPGHMLTVAQTGDIYVASLTGNVFKWQPNPRWPLRAPR
jgi:peptidylamidoglycolate lyase